MNGRLFVTNLIRQGGIYGLTAEKFSLGRSNPDVVRAMLDAGVRIVQYREKTKKMGAKYEECLALRAMTREAGAAFIVNDDIDLALLVDADGVHVGQEDLPVAAVRALVGDGRAIGLSTHSPDQARTAAAAGADYIGVGPIFATQTKDDVCAPVGLSYLDFAVREAGLPCVAIGGIKEHNLAEVVRRGAGCVAMVTEVVGATDIRTRVAALHQILRGGPHGIQTISDRILS
jgi:thiamine-phosphate pyrophosphorylase